MPRKPKFRPEITRVKLNPEQAVLSCNCDTMNIRLGASSYFKTIVADTVCVVGSRSTMNVYYCNPIEAAEKTAFAMEGFTGLS